MTIKELVMDLRKNGFTVYLAEKGTYGFYTDDYETRITDFEMDLGGIRFSGNYRTNMQYLTGEGWTLERDSYYKMLYAYPPYWATKGSKWHFTTVQEQLKRYNASSRYTKLEPLVKESE
jgi:hypothetical protein